MVEDINFENLAMIIIASSGEARSLAFKSLEEAREQNFDAAEESLELAEKSALKAHKAQTELLTYEANGKVVDISILLIHAQDHLMTSMLALELIREMVKLYQR